MSCEAAAPALPALAVGDEPAPAGVRAHVEQCLRCQADIAAYRRMLRVMRALAGEQRDPGPAAVGELLAMLAEASDPDRAPLRWAVSVGGVAAAAASAAGVLVWRSRRRLALVG